MSGSLARHGAAALYLILWCSTGRVLTDTDHLLFHVHKHQDVHHLIYCIIWSATESKHIWLVFKGRAHKDQVRPGLSKS